MKILQIANYVEDLGGISIQVKLLRDLLHGDGFDCDILSTKGSITKRFMAFFSLLAKGRRYDVFHIHACSGLGFFPAVYGITIGRLLKKRIILTFHGGGAERFFRKRHKFVKFFLSKTSANIVLSGFIGHVFDQYGISYTIIPNVLVADDSAFKVRTAIKPRFISIRSLAETYNIECTLKAFGAVQEKYPDATLTLLGDGPLKSSLEQYVIEHHLQNVTFVGQVPNSKIFRYLDDADIMVSSSRFDNMPVSILEGFKAGLLVIASNVGGIPFMIEDGRNGFLFETENYLQMSEKMMAAVEMSRQSLKMIESAHWDLKHYSWGVISTKLLPLYNHNL